MRRSLPALELVFIIAALLAALPLAAQPPASTTAPSENFVKGMELLRTAKYSQAIPLLAEVVKAEPTNEPAWFSLGVAKFHTGDNAGALEAFRTALSLFPDRPGTRLYIGRLYEAQGAYQEAIAVFSEEARRTTGSAQAEAQVALARTYYKAAAYEHARDTADIALDNEPRYVEALYIGALARHRVGDYKGAIERFKRAKDILQEWSDLNSALHRLQMHPEQVRERKLTEERMAQDYNWAQDFAQDMGMWPALNKSLGDSYLANKEYSMARASYRHAADLNQLGDKTDADVLVRVARANLADAMNQFTQDNQLFAAIALLREADTTLDQALQLDAKSAEAYEVRGEIYTFQAETYDAIPKFGITTHSFADAEAAFTKALQNAPGMADAMAGLAKVNLRQAEQRPGQQKSKDMLTKALGLVQQALTIRPDSAKYYTLLGQIYLAQEKYTEARGAAEKAEALDPKYAEAYNTSGLANYFTGNLGQALRDFQKAIELSPHEPHYHFNLGNTYFQMQSWYLARREYGQALKYTPSATLAKTTAQRAYIHYMTALTYHETRDYDSEVTTLNQALAIDISYFDAYLQLARAHAAKKEFRAAQRALDAAQSRAANRQENSQVETLSGQIFESAGDIHAAVAAYSRAVNLDRNNVAAQEALKRLSGQG